jgi:hypothetical protein
MFDDVAIEVSHFATGVGLVAVAVETADPDSHPASPPARIVSTRRSIGREVQVVITRGHCCVTVNACPAMAIVSDRAWPALGSTRNPTWPSPFPLVPVVNVIHDAELEAVQAQPGGAATSIVPVPPAAGIEALVGLITHVQDPGFCAT